MSRDDARVPGVDDWQRAADGGAASRAAAEARRAAPAWTPASAALPMTLQDELVAWCRDGLPNEACGLLVGAALAEDGGVPSRFMGSATPPPRPIRYLIDPEEQLRVVLEIDDADEVVWGIVHSHVASPPAPSATDVGLAAVSRCAVSASARSRPSRPQVRAWTIRRRGVGEVELEPR